MITSSPYLAFFQSEYGGTIPSASNPRKFHDRVVWSFFPLFKKTDTTSGCSALIKKDKPLAEISTVSWNGSYNETSDKKEATESKKDLSLFC